ncbi:biopolymer transporter Tol [Enterobacterales bacterium CwR94]|nr:biopolymer transporter Tol [Enterobacterales bacterium CwR94]
MTVKQVTFAAQHHQLTNINVWTADSQWLVYDVRPSGASFTGLTLERVNVHSGEVEVLYTAQHGAHVGVVTVSAHLPPRYAFIQGPEHPDAQWQYDFHHRRGVILMDGQAHNMEACDITPPYTPGALRGGSHVHVFSPDGSRLSYTYNDHVMHEWDAREDLRNVGVAVPLCPVTPPKTHPRECDGDYFCVLVSQTTAQPVPGSNDINRAYEEGWVGDNGYRRADGTQQRWALAFIGDTLNLAGEKHPEVFIVDLPAELAAYAQEGDAPLAGSETRLPAPPAGVQQRRLTFTPQGIALQPRHWLRSSPDGSRIAFLMADAQQVVQLWTVSPNGGEPQQLTHSAHSIQSAFSWHPQGTALAFICDNSVMLCDSQSGELTRLTVFTTAAPSGDAVVFSPDGQQIAWMQEVAGWRQLFTVTIR